jgi:hypothetical protein
MMLPKDVKNLHPQKENQGMALVVMDQEEDPLSGPETDIFAAAL